MDLKEALVSVGLGDLEGILTSTGVSCVADLKYFSVTDLKGIGFNHVQAGKALELFEKNAAGSASTGIAPPGPPGAVPSGDMGQVTAMAEATDPTGDSEAVDEENDGDENEGNEEDDEELLDATVDIRGGRRTAAQREELAKSRADGAARFRGHGDGLLVVARGDCCKAFLKSLDGKLLTALRTRDELNRSTGSKRKYQYTRLVSCLIASAFDSQGNFCCHSICLIRHLDVSTSQISRVLKRAVELAGNPTKDLFCSDIIRRGLCDRAVLPDGNLLARATFFKTCAPELKFPVILSGLPSHGLTGRPSNRRREREMEIFEAFVKTNRSATGRTPDSHGRYHGAVFTLSAKIVCIKSKEDIYLKRYRAGDPRPVLPTSHAKIEESLSGIFNLALKDVMKTEGKTFIPVSPSSVSSWLARLFPKRSSEHTIIHDHKSDACSDCEQMLADINSIQASLMRHRQQEGDRTPARDRETNELEDDKKDLEDSHRTHLGNADHAMVEYKTAIKHAPEEYSEMTSLFNDAVMRGRAGSISERRQIAKEFAEDAASLIVKGISDWQQDKHAPQWNQSPQPSPTYFIPSDVSLYIFSQWSPSG